MNDRNNSIFLTLQSAEIGARALAYPAKGGKQIIDLGTFTKSECPQNSTERESFIDKLVEKIRYHGYNGMVVISSSLEYPEDYFGVQERQS